MLNADRLILPPPLTSGTLPRHPTLPIKVSAWVRENLFNLPTQPRGRRVLASGSKSLTAMVLISGEIWARPLDPDGRLRESLAIEWSVIGYVADVYVDALVRQTILIVTT
jgi:hypothetical protein